ncbi:MAG: hypothetical protein KDE14_08415 [Rhodobacteraceae bacterium]|nr:hypothetical protein [Paracoccaceae bacterium]
MRTTDRRTAIALGTTAIGVSVGAAAIGAGAYGQSEPAPLINRIRMTTIGAADIDAVATWFSQWLGYRITDVGKIGAEVAASWGAPGMAGRGYAIVAPPASKDVGIRVVQIDVPDGAKASGTFGWSGVEIICEDVHKLYEKFKDGPVHVIRPPSSLGEPFASIHAMQVQGPADVVVAITTETGDREASNLPVPKSAVDRVFLVGVNGTEAGVLRKFYIDTFAMRPGPVFDSPSPRLAKELGLPESTIFGLTLVRAAQKGNTVELHGLPPPGGPRKQTAGQLPPGVAMVSFGVGDLDALKLDFLTPPAKRAKMGYGNARAATFVGPAGELIELIEEK